jgi:hypothetical protein
MKYFAFLSRHQPTREQYELAERAGIKLVNVGDLDAFTVEGRMFRAYPVDAHRPKP